MKRFAGICFIAVLFSSCSSLGKFVKIFHIRSQHKIPTYVFSASEKVLKIEFEKLFSSYPDLLLTDGHTNNYTEGTYFAHVTDSVSRRAFAIRFGFYVEDSHVENNNSVIKIFSIRNEGETEWRSFFANKVSRKKMKESDSLIQKNIFSRMAGIKFILKKE